MINDFMCLICLSNIHTRILNSRQSVTSQNNNINGNGLSVYVSILQNKVKFVTSQTASFSRFLFTMHSAEFAANSIDTFLEGGYGNNLVIVNNLYLYRCDS